MRIKAEEVVKVAALARLALTEGEVDMFTRELDGILEHFATIDEHALAGDVTRPVTDRENNETLREDEPVLFADQEKLHRNVKHMKEGLIVVPKIVE